MNVDILNLEWSSSGSRDRIVASLVCNYLREKGYNVYEGSVFKGYSLLDDLKPKVLFMTNSVGADINLKTIKYAASKSIPSITLLSEGNFLEGDKNTEIFAWGINNEKILYENYSLYWTIRTLKQSLNLYPQLTNRIFVSGSVGFDTYKIISEINNTDFLKKYKKENYKKIIGIGCWDFGILEETDHRYVWSRNQFGDEAIKKLKNDKIDFNLILKKIIINNPSILFLLKKHPGVLNGNTASGIEGLELFENVLIIKDEEPIIDCILISDFWLSYESTTALEAWLLDKQTCLLNPNSFFWKRDPIHLGSPIFRTYDELNDAIYSFYKKKIIPGFNIKIKEREKLISDFSEFRDGFNHVRVGNFIIENISTPVKSKIKIKDYFLLKIIALKQKLMLTISRYLMFVNYFKNFQRRVETFNDQEVQDYSSSLRKLQIKFYTKKNSSLSDFKVISGEKRNT